MFGARILILAPHPDDEIVGCAGAIQRAVAQGSQVFVMYLTTGVPAGRGIDRERHLAQRIIARRRESIIAGRLLGYAAAGYQDHPARALRRHLGASREYLETRIAQLRPNIIWAPAFEGAHQDHDAANALASTFADAIPVWEYAAYNYAGGRIRSQALPSENGSEIVLSLTQAERNAKQTALRAYRSERGNLRHVAVDTECFRPLPAHDYARPPHEGTLFYQRFRWVPFRHPRIDDTHPREVAADLVSFLNDRAFVRQAAE